MKNPLLNCDVDNGVMFVRFLRDECAPELEKLTQDDINAMTRIIRKRSDRACWVAERDNPLEQLKKLPEPTPKKKKAAPKKKKK